MCFSAEASFAAGAVLIPAGGYCIAAAIRKRPRYVPLAMVPLFFGLQQIAEGFVWLGLHDGHHPEMVRPGSLVFLFFALALWPFWFPFLTAVMERRRVRKRWYSLLALATTGWFWILFFPILTGPESILSVEVVHHSLQYQYPTLGIYEIVPITLLRIIYLTCIALPMALTSEGLGKIPSLCLADSAVAAFLIYDYAFVSVWCFFAAIMSAYLVWMFYRLEKE